MARRILAVLFLSSVLLAPLRIARAQDDVPETKGAFVNALAKATFIDLIQRRSIVALYAHEPDFVYDVFREAWPKITDLNVRRQLLTSLADLGNGGYEQ